MLRIVLLIFLFSMACMGQTFQYSRGWTNGKRSGNPGNFPPKSFTNLFHKDEDVMPELFDIQEMNDRRLERCIFQLQHAVRNPLLLHSAAAALALNPLTASSNPNQIGGNSNRNSNNINNGNSNNNPFARSHQSNELFEELSSTVIDSNDYGKH